MDPNEIRQQIQAQTNKYDLIVVEPVVAADAASTAALLADYWAQLRDYWQGQ